MHYKQPNTEKTNKQRFVAFELAIRNPKKNYTATLSTKPLSKQFDTE